MNEQIKLIAEKAGLNIHNDINDGHSFNHEIERFAFLIIQECMRQVAEQYTPVLEDELMMKETHWYGYVHCGVDSYVAIREHFYGEQE